MSKLRKKINERADQYKEEDEKEENIVLGKRHLAGLKLSTARLSSDGFS